jgi:G3E family GTPase
MNPIDREARLPVTIITGFLGSGKTTLVNHVLASEPGVKIGVIVNEIGEIAIDGELIIGIDDDMVELSNGCICCSINNDLVDAVFRVLRRRQKLDHLVVECSGLADPLPVVLTFLRSEFRDLVRIDSIVAIADADSFSLELFASTAAENQLRYADTIVLNKCDLASTDRLCSIEAKIRAFKAGARLLRATRCRVPVPLLLGVGSFQPDRYGSGQLDWDHAHLANDGFEWLSFEAQRPFTADKFQSFLEQLSVNVFRAKGVLWIAESEKRYVFHLVGQRFTLDESQWAGPAESRLVLIGRGLDRKGLRARLEACLASGPSIRG